MYIFEGPFLVSKILDHSVYELKDIACVISILVGMSYSVTDKLELLLLQLNDPVTGVIPDNNLLVRI
jgi:hypothetical protein